MMYREFDSEPVKDTCEESGVHYVNPTRIFTNSDEADTIGWMYRNGKRFHVTEAESDDGTPTRKQIYLPKRSSSDSQDDDDGLSEAWEELYGDWEFEDVEGEPSEGMSFSRLLSDIRREEEVEDRKQKAQNEEVDTARTVVFETNHPYVTPGDTDDQQMDGKACVLYNVWRLVDLLVKLTIDGENRSYAPRVDANQFLTVAENCYGLDPPD